MEFVLDMQKLEVNNITLKVEALISLFHNNEQKIETFNTFILSNDIYTLTYQLYVMINGRKI